jgi:hypothetical protein
MITDGHFRGRSLHSYVIGDPITSQTYQLNKRYLGEGLKKVFCYGWKLSSHCHGGMNSSVLPLGWVFKRRHYHSTSFKTGMIKRLNNYL